MPNYLAEEHFIPATCESEWVFQFYGLASYTIILKYQYHSIPDNTDQAKSFFSLHRLQQKGVWGQHQKQYVIRRNISKEDMQDEYESSTSGENVTVLTF